MNFTIANLDVVETMTCLACGHESLSPAVIVSRGERRGQSFEISVSGYKCSVCAFQTMDSIQSEEFTRRLSDAYRSANGLLTSDEIRSLRNRIQMTQQEFANFLPVGVASLRRWELGQIQDRAMDQLIRLKTDPKAARLNSQIVSGQAFEECLVSNTIFDGRQVQLSFKPRPKNDRAKAPIQMCEIDFRNYDLVFSDLIAA